jgi:putative phage-type endonuclease
MNLQQQSPEWFKARESRLTASDFGSAAGVKGAYNTRQKLWELKTGRDWVEANEYMQYGLDTEPIAKVAFEIITGDIVRDSDLVIHPDHNFLACSPDGLIDSGSVLEIKCPTRAVHSQISEQFLGQIFGQLACTGRETALFFSYHPRGQRLWQVKWSEEYWSWMFPLLEEFWNHVIEDECPRRRKRKSFCGELDITELSIMP